jgi:hypothetical protein
VIQFATYMANLGRALHNDLDFQINAATQRWLLEGETMPGIVRMHPRDRAQLERYYGQPVVAGSTFWGLEIVVDPRWDAPPALE